MEYNGTLGRDDDGNGHADDTHGHNPAIDGFTIRDKVGDVYGIYAVGMAVVANNNGTGARGAVGGIGNGDGACTTLR